MKGQVNEMITERQQAILNRIVDIFTKTHEPVGSKALQEVISASSATIRNDMAALEKQGLLEKAHTSSGRMPSIAGYQYFVQHSLSYESLAEDELYQVVRAFDQEFFHLDDILNQAASVLANLTGCTVLALDVEPTHQRLTAFEIVVVSQHAALAIMTLDDARTVTQQFVIPRSLLPEDLERLRDLVRERFLGQTVLNVHYKIRTEIPQILQRYFTVTDNLLELFDHLFEPLFQEQVALAGKVNLLKFADQETFQHFEDLQQVAFEVRDKFPEGQSQFVRVADPLLNGLEDLTLITSSFLIPYRGFGLLALVGPVNLDYQRVVNLINLVTRVLTMKLTDFYRYLSSNHYEVH